MLRSVILSFIFLLSICITYTAHAQPCIATFPFNETFEATNGNWTPGGTSSDWAWGTPAKTTINAAGQGNKCWLTGGLTASSYNSAENSYLQSPCFNFSTLVNPRISFKIFWETEQKYDGAALQYSTDGGASWNLLGSINSNSNCLGQNWYNTPSVIYLGSGAGWSGTVNTGSCSAGQGGSGGWLTASHDLSPLAGKTNVMFRFVFGAGTVCNSFDGFAIDDVNIFEGPPNSASFTSTCRPGRTVNFSNTSLCSTGSSWNFGDPASGANNISAAFNEAHNFSAAGTYIVTLTSTFAAGPPASITTPVTILDVMINVTQPSSCGGAQAATLAAIPSGSTGAYMYAWNTNPVQTTQTIITGAGNYIVTINSGAACPASDTVEVIAPLPLTISPVVTAQQCTVNNGAITANVSGGEPAYNYLWSNGATTSAISDLAAGSYSLHVTDANGCTADSMNIIVVHTDRPAAAELGADAVICPGEKLLLSPGIFSSYLWQDNSMTATYTVTVTGDYSVTVTDAAGCTGFDKIHVTVDCSDIYFPAAFTPNGDSKNELFGPAGSNLSVVKNYRLDIYNRYGQLAFHSGDPYLKWNGKFENKISGNETFVWMASYSINGKQRFKKGTVTLIK